MHLLTTYVYYVIDYFKAFIPKLLSFQRFRVDGKLYVFVLRASVLGLIFSIRSVVRKDTYML